MLHTDIHICSRHPLIATTTRTFIVSTIKGMHHLFCNQFDFFLCVIMFCNDAYSLKSIQSLFYECTVLMNANVFFLLLEQLIKCNSVCFSAFSFSS